MANYTPEEQRELNSELKRWQNKLAKYINSDKWDIIVDQLSDIELDQITIVNRANSYRDVNWLVWQNMDKIINKVQNMYNKPKCFNGRLQNKYCYAQTKSNGYLYKKCLDCKWNNYNR